MSQEHILDLDPLIHAPIRLAILSVLITVENANFTYLKKTVNTTDGNLSTHLAKLENAGYVEISKSFLGKKPQTVCAITEKGRDAFVKYIDNLELIIKKQKGKS
jgi:DNA-binding MarR family transcriptional regulator